MNIVTGAAEADTKVGHHARKPARTLKHARILQAVPTLNAFFHPCLACHTT